MKPLDRLAVIISCMTGNFYVFNALVIKVNNMVIDSISSMSGILLLSLSTIVLVMIMINQLVGIIEFLAGNN